MKLYIDINTCEIRTAITASPIRLLRFHRGNILPLSLILTDNGVIVTSATLGSSVGLRLAIASVIMKSGSAPIIEQDSFPLIGEIATGSIDLTGQALTDYFANYVPAGTSQAIFKVEIQAVNTSGSFRQTYFTGECIIVREIIPFTAFAPQAITDNTGAAMTDNSGTAITN